MQSVPREMAELLGSLQSEGKVDSAGIFTLDIRKALPKLQAYQLAKKHYYIPKMVQAAVASNASEVRIWVNELRVKIEFDGTPFGAGELRELLNYLFREQGEARRLRHLATAINTAVALDAWSVQLSSGPGSAVVTQRWLARDQNKLFKAEKLWKPGQVMTRFELWRGLSDMSSKWWHTAGKADLWDLLTGNERAMTEEQSELVTKCMYCPVPVYLNGRRVNRPRFGESARASMFSLLNNSPDYFQGAVHKRHHLVERFVLVDGSDQVLGAPQSTASYHEDRRYSSREAPGPALLALEFGGSPNILRGGGKRAQIEFVLDGVRIDQKVFESPVANARAVVSAEGLNLDLGQFGITDDEVLRQRIEWLVGHFQEMDQILRDRADAGQYAHIRSDALRQRLTW